MLGAAPRGREAEDGVESPPLLPAERLHLLQRRSARTRQGRARRGPLLPPQRDPEDSADRAARRVHSPVSETRARRQRPLKGGVSGRGPGGLLASLWLGWGKALSAEPCRRRISGAHRGSQARVQEMEFSGVTASCPRAPPVPGPWQPPQELGLARGARFERADPTRGGGKRPRAGSRSQGRLVGQG